jgi:hypothetical protein
VVNGDGVFFLMTRTRELNFEATKPPWPLTWEVLLVHLCSTPVPGNVAKQIYFYSHSVTGYIIDSVVPAEKISSRIEMKFTLNGAE